MKVHSRNLQLSALALAVSGALLPMSAVAEDEAAASKVPANSVEVGVSNTSKSSAKFGEYNGLNKSGVDFVGNFSLRGGAYDNIGSTTRWSLNGSDLGLTTRAIGGEYSEQGRWRLGFNYDELRHNLTDTYQPKNGSCACLYVVTF